MSNQPDKIWPYEQRADSRIWSRPGFEGIAYSDGTEAERGLLDFLRHASDLSSLSDELAGGIDAWMREAHLSPARANLLRPLDWTGRRRVLELGAGCGALTRFLGEEGLHVDAVEGSLLRAECAAERCRDLVKVRVIADEITAFEGDGTYDVVTLIGVLEYSPIFIEATDPIRACLEMARRHLSPDGVLVLAIENQLGLKYFNMCAEDHLGTPFAGITDLYGRKTAVTFGKLELEAKLREAGFARVDWSFPFPDYKLPTTVISARALRDADFRAGEMLLGEFSRDYGGSVMRSFDETAVWSVLERNGVLGDFANSFLIVASMQAANPLDDGTWLACRYSPHRLKAFSTSTRIARRAEGLMVHKMALAPSDGTSIGSDGDFRLEQRTGAEPYVRGRLLAHDFIDAVGRGYAPADLAPFLKSWVDFLASQAVAPRGATLSSLRLPGHLLDCIPTNLVIDEEGRLCPIDLEFAVPGDIPVTWVVLRGIVHLASKCFGHRELLRTSFQSFLDQILSGLGFGEVADWTEAFEMEDSLIRVVLRTWPDRPERGILRKRLELPIATVHSIVDYERALQASGLTRRHDLPALQSAIALSENLGRWFALLPDPAAPNNAREGHERANPGLIAASDAIAQQLQHVYGSDFRERIRGLALLRGRWAALARDNQRLAWELNDQSEQLESLRRRSEQAELDASKAELLRREISALQQVLGEQRARIVQAEADVAKVEPLEREIALLQQVLNEQRARIMRAESDATKAELLGREIEGLQQALNEQRARIVQAEAGAAKVEPLEREIAVLQQVLNEQRARIVQAERGAAKVEPLEREIAVLQQVLNEQRARIVQAEALGAQMEPLEREVAVLRQQREEQMGRIAHSERAVEQAQRGEREAERVNQERKAHAQSLEKELITLKETLRNERTKFSAVTDDLDRTRLQLAAADATLEDFIKHRPDQKRWEALNSELAAVREAAQKHVVAKLSVQAELETVKATLAKTERTLLRDEGRIAVLREELKTIKEESRLLRQTLDGTRNRLQRRSAEISRIHAKLRELTTRMHVRPHQPAPPARARWFSRRQSVEKRRAPAEDSRLATRAVVLKESGLFDEGWYVRKYGSAEDVYNPALHYMLSTGEFDPNQLFHESWYRRQYGSTFAPGESGLEHYLRSGMANGCEPNELFDSEWYVGTNADLLGYKYGALHHYLNFGWREGRDPHPLFDTDWFFREYKDAANAAPEMNPLAYFFEMVTVGALSPCEFFDTEWYLSQYPDIEGSGMNPLVHYLEHGVREGRNPSPTFDTRWYLDSNRDVTASGMNPLLHYRVAGLSEGRRPMARKMPEELVAEGIAYVEPSVVIDGVVEWSDYEPLKSRIAGEAAAALGQVRYVAPPMVCVLEDQIDEAIAALTFEHHAHPRVSIVIPVYNKLSVTVECLASIQEAHTAVSFEIIVADDGSADSSGERLARVPGLVVHRNEKNLGFLRNCNSAFPLVRGEYVLLLNNDVQVTPGWLDALVRSFDTFDRLGAVGPKIIYPSGHLQEAGVAVRGDGSVEMVGLFDDPQKAQYNYARQVDYVSGACLLLQAAVLQELGGFSEEFLPCYCEDSDLCMRIRQRGLRIVYQPDATVVHHLSKTTADSAHDVKLRAVASSLASFTCKWQEELDRLTQVRVLAFYLPQFHPTPENDHWWGTGFTEWHNVTRARPNFVGHYQPRLPADLGFYDLRLSEVMEAQAALARRYGVYGFCCYYYWFAGKRLLESPIERMLTTGRPDIPYSLCWANENWTRRWDGEDQEILIAQKYSPEDDEAVICDLMRHFRNPNYIRIDGKPLLLVYRVSMFPDFRATADRWRASCRREGIGDIYLAMVESFDLVNAGAHPASYNCDASVEFPPLGMAQARAPSGPVVNPEFMGHVADYRDIAARFCARPMPGYTRFRGVMAGWDNTARRQNNSFCFESATPGAFQAWLETAIAQTRSQHHAEERIVFVNAWNEWAEGAYLEPDRRYGHAFLEAVRNAQEADSLMRMSRYALDL